MKKLKTDRQPTIAEKLLQTAETDSKIYYVYCLYRFVVGGCIIITNQTLCFSLLESVEVKMMSICGRCE